MKRKREGFTVEGSIVRITMENFMTYKHQTFWPGPNFNVTVGPNGSGKSSIVTALSIALGGDLKSLNRQADLASLVNSSAESKEANVEIELFIKEGRNVIVTCNFNAMGNPPIWKINGKECGKKALADMMEGLQIQPGNLCQFLPQDVVRDFPTMNNQQIFYNTVKAIGDNELLETYDILKDIERDIKYLEDEKETKENTLEHLERKEQRLSVDRELMEKRKKLEEKKLTIENYILWQSFNNLRIKTKASRVEERKYGTMIKEKEAEQSPVSKFLEFYEEKVAKLNKDMEIAYKEFQENSNNVEIFDTIESEEKLDRLVESEKDINQREMNRLESKKRLNKEIEELKSQIETAAVDPDIDKKIQELMAIRSKREGQLSRTEQQKSEIEFQRSSSKKEVDKHTRRREQLHNKSNQKLATLLKENKDAHDGVLWLRQNKDVFKKPVHEPIMLCLDVKSPLYAKLVETQIGRADLEGFVCESPDDVNLLSKKLREELGLKKINAFHSDPDNMSKFPHPHSRDELGKYAFEEYLSDMYEAPVAVQAYLCRQKHLHKIPYFASENNFSDDLKYKFNDYFIGLYKYNTRKSKYSGELSTGCDDIGARRVVRLAATVDRLEVERVQNELEKKETDLAKQEDRNVKVKNNEILIRKALADIQIQLNELKIAKNILPKLKSELAMKEKTLTNVQRPEFDINEAKKSICQKKKMVVFKLCHSMDILKNLIKASVDKDVERKVLHLTYQNIAVENSENVGKKELLKREIDELRVKHREVTVLYELQKHDLQIKQYEAEKATGILCVEKNGIETQVRNKPSKIWATRFAMLEKSDVDALGALLDDCETELKRAKPISDKTKAEIQAINGKLDAARSEKKRIDEAMTEKTHEADRLKRKWLNGVEVLVDKIDKKFGSMMANLGYAGQIQLSQGRRDIDFSSYGISIKVRFRSGQEMQELSRGVQSGGEKSVTTAVYMMALQELTQVPFRCVDEINQGMDERNERMVWDQLLDVCRKYKAQYFYMVPKFPYNLPFDDQVTIVVCNNGAVGKRSHREYRVKTFVEMAKRMKLST